ncbi:MAG: TonB-dependent receptor [Acidobacteriota bacterium]
MKSTGKSIYILIISFFISISSLNAKEIRGTVRDITFKIISNVSILVKETGISYFPFPDGTFSIKVPDTRENIYLIFSNDTHYSKTVKINLSGKLKKLNIILVPKEYQQNEMTVTAFDEEENHVTAPKAESIISELEIKEKISENLVDTMANTPGVHFIGSGGFMVTPSIRGLARRRVLLLVDGARITGDRRVGSSGSFLSPELIRKIEIVRSSSSVIYGSDAIGGVIQLITGPEENGVSSQRSFNLNLGSINSRFNSGFSLTQNAGDIFINSGIQYSQAKNYSSPDSEIFNSGYKNISGIFNVSYRGQKRSIIFKYIGGFGSNIGKPDRENDPDITSTVSDDINQFLVLKYNESGLIKNYDLKINLFFNPTKYALEKSDLNNGLFQYSDTRSANYGLSVKVSGKITNKINLNMGFDQYIRNNMKIVNRTQNGSSDMTSTPIDNGFRNDSGFFISTGIESIPGLSFKGGFRYSFFKLKANSNEISNTRRSGSPGFFLGITKSIGKSVSLFFNTGTAFRNPSLSESFYTGITGRRYVIGNPALLPEKSFNIDSGIRLFFKNFYMGFYLFSNNIKNMIERYRDENNIYTYNNIDKGHISGSEIELQWFPVKNIELFGHGFYYKGTSKETENPINDIPSPKIFLGGKTYYRKLWFEVNFKGGWYFSSRFFLYLKASNLLNRFYYANPDPDIPAGEGLSLSAGLNFFF